jgi:glycosyltransferase involved in cell wall biosynthesis
MARFFHDAGYVVRLIGRRLPSRRVIVVRTYSTKRFRLLFNKGFMFYACYNIRLCCYLLFRPAMLFVANDLDTLPANYLVSRLRKIPLLYDSHELFTGVPELIGREPVRRFWAFLERKMLPGLTHGITVSPSIAAWYMDTYGIDMHVIRNLPEYCTGGYIDSIRKEPELPVVIYQGALNMGRGLENLILSMTHLKSCRLHLAGEGDIRRELEQLVEQHGLGDKVRFLGHLSFRELQEHTVSASLGVSLEEDLGPNYYFALPNKLFDYIQARIPVLVSDFPEMGRIIDEYGVGVKLADRQPGSIARTIDRMIRDSGAREVWLANLEKAARELCWEREAAVLRELVKHLNLQESCRDQ